MKWTYNPGEAVSFLGASGNTPVSIYLCPAMGYNIRQGYEILCKGCCFCRSIR